MLVRLVYLTHEGTWLVVIEFDITLLRLRMNIRKLIKEAVLAEEDLIKLRVPTN